jgi:hypothetical protein
MNPRRGARVLAASRAALGVAVLLAPEQVTRRWLGEQAGHPAVRYLARSLGARDLALGVLALATLEDPELGPRTQAWCAVADSVDALATIAARSDLPPAGVIGTVAVAGAAAGAGFLFSHRLAHP